MLSAPISFIINSSFKVGVFIKKLKIVQVDPVHKKNATRLCPNYRSISLLSTFIKHFGKTMYDRVILLVFLYSAYLISNLRGVALQRGAIGAYFKLKRVIHMKL